VLVSGATGIGKTLMVTEFMKSGIEASERSLLVSFEEDHEQLLCNAASWGTT
jgi:circadian clock protein KaiC